MATKKGQGSSRNGRDSNSQRLGVKSFDGNLVTGGSVLVELPGRRASAQVLDKVSYQTSWRAQAEHGGFYQAVAAGIYRKYGIECDLRMGGPQISLSQLLMGGRVETEGGVDQQGGDADRRRHLVGGVGVMEPAMMVGRPVGAERGIVGQDPIEGPPHRLQVLQPFRLKSLTLRNRLISTAHEPAYTEDGLPKDRYRLYHVEKARGGIGMTMIGGSSIVAPDSVEAFGNIQLFM